MATNIYKITGNTYGRKAKIKAADWDKKAEFVGGAWYIKAGSSDSIHSHHDLTIQVVDCKPSQVKSKQHAPNSKEITEMSAGGEHQS